jgi:hypothetical protein
MMDLIMSDIIASFKGSVELKTVVEGGLAAENLHKSTTITSEEFFFFKSFFGVGFFVAVVVLASIPPLFQMLTTDLRGRNMQHPSEKGHPPHRMPMPPPPSEEYWVKI